MSAPTSLINENHGSIDVLFGGTDPWPSQNKSHATAKWIGTFKRPLDIPKYRPVWGYERWARTAPCDPRPSCTEMRRAFFFIIKLFHNLNATLFLKNFLKDVKRWCQQFNGRATTDAPLAHYVTVSIRTGQLHPITRPAVEPLPPPTHQGVVVVEQRHWVRGSIYSLFWMNV